MILGDALGAASGFEGWAVEGDADFGERGADDFGGELAGLCVAAISRKAFSRPLGVQVMIMRAGPGPGFMKVCSLPRGAKTKLPGPSTDSRPWMENLTFPSRIKKVSSSLARQCIGGPPPGGEIDSNCRSVPPEDSLSTRSRVESPRTESTVPEPAGTTRGRPLDIFEDLANCGFQGPLDPVPYRTGGLHGRKSDSPGDRAGTAPGFWWHLWGIDCL